MPSLAPDLTRKAKTVIALLVDAEPRPANHGPGWIVTVERRIRTERWDDVCALVAEHPDLDPEALADMAAAPGASAPAGGNFQTAEQTPPPLPHVSEIIPLDWHTRPCLPVDDAKARIAAMRTALPAARKPPMGDPPITLRGAVA